MKKLISLPPLTGSSSSPRWRRPKRQLSAKVILLTIFLDGQHHADLHIAPGRIMCGYGTTCRVFLVEYAQDHCGRGTNQVVQAFPTGDNDVLPLSAWLYAS